MRSDDDGVTAPAAVSEELAALGPFFAVEFHGAEGGTVGEAPRYGAGGVPEAGRPGLAEARAESELRGHGPGGVPEAGRPGLAETAVAASSWRPMTELVDGSSVLAERVEAVRGYLATGTGQEASAVELRVAASVVHLGLMARVLSPLLAIAALHRRSGLVRVADLRWQPTLGSMFPLSVRAAALDSGTGFEGCVGEFGAVVARFGVNEHILRGNVASGLAAAGRTLAEAHPDLRDDVRALIGEHLAGAGGYEPDGTFRRRSCCLIYRAAPDHKGGLCGDCALAPHHGPMDT